MLGGLRPDPKFRMATSRKKTRSKSAAAPSDSAATAPLKPVTRKIGETPGNLEARSVAFKRRREKTE